MNVTKLKYYFLVRSWNSLRYFDRCIDSILSQRGNYTILFVDDCSDYTRSQQQYIQKRLKGHIVVFNKERKFAIRNAYDVIHSYIENDDAIVINVDGDDWLAHDHVMRVVGEAYVETRCLLTYGNCRYFDPNGKLHNRVASDNYQVNHRYPAVIEKHNTYRKYFFVPLHLRTWKAGLFKRIHPSSFLRQDGSWQESCEDESMFLPMLEMAHGRYEVLQEILYVYNRDNVFNDNKMSRTNLLVDELTILRQSPYPTL